MNYLVIGADGNQYPADIPTLQEWARTGRIVRETLLLDQNTGIEFPAERLIALQAIFPPAGGNGNFRSTSPPLTAAQQRGTPLSQQRWLVVLLLLFCTPIGLILLWSMRKEGVGTKIAGTVVFGGLLLLNIALLSHNESTPGERLPSGSLQTAAAPAAGEITSARSGVGEGESTQTEAPTEQLKLLKWSWGEGDSEAFIEARGQVKNISTESLRNVMAVVSYYDKEGEFITSDETLISYNPILPGQTSPFHVMTTNNPAMVKATIEFKELMGGTIPTARP